MLQRNELSDQTTWVVKIGSSLLTDHGRGLNLTAIADWVQQIARLKQQQKQVLLVSSGSVAEGLCRLAWTARPHALHQLQAVAAIGQMGLIQAYESQFQQHQLHTAQILLTHDDCSNRQRYLNARSTLRTLLNLNVVPIINENDTVVTDEIRFGDNDTLAALVCNLVEANVLVLLTDQDGLFTHNPQQYPEKAQLITESLVTNPDLDTMAGDSFGHLGRGGMQTKLRAARIAARSGTATLIANGKQADILIELSQGKDIGSLLLPEHAPMTARKQWLAGQLQMKGQLYLDQGAIHALQQQGKSLLSIGVTKVTGEFNRGELVACVDTKGKEIARGLINYNDEETSKILRQSSQKIEAILGYIDEPELIHRDNLIVV